MLNGGVDDRQPEDGSGRDGIALACFGCCPPSERRWFKWVLMAQSVLALAIVALAY